MEMKQEKQVYEEPSVTVIAFENRDIITSSIEGIEGEFIPGPGGT